MRPVQIRSGGEGRGKLEKSGIHQRKKIGNTALGEAVQGEGHAAGIVDREKGDGIRGIMLGIASRKKQRDLG